MVVVDTAEGLSDFWLNILGLAVCGVLGLTACGMVKGLLALVRLHTASRNDTKRLAELKASKAASLQAVVEDLAGIDPDFDVDGAAVDLFSNRQPLDGCHDDAVKEMHATRLCGKGYVSLAKADHPWPCALVEHFDWVRNNLFDLEPIYFTRPLPGQCGRDGKVPTAPEPELMSINPHYRMRWEQALHAPQSA
eukprot:jgi/Astpho2/1083/fgenesh1_pg.00018_%23_3_t